MSNPHALNAVCFGQEHWKLIAKGYDVRAWYDEGVGKGTGGIKSPVRQSLEIGHRYYRFSSGDKGLAGHLGGGWWISYEIYKHILEFSKSNSLDLPYAARLWLALPYDWSRVDRLVSAVLCKPIDAYQGAGKQVELKDETWTPPQHQKLTQMYIPGLLQNSSVNELYKKVWTKVEFKQARTGKALKRRAMEPA
ncbi:MAG: hypothetical protein MI867_21270 [Pseudomonadales bacterium]|nr:hypothetical protein [Pseudomonadales bacterium]